jgi:hypothetical protein
MATFLAKKGPFNSLHVVDANGESVLGKIAAGDIVSVEVKKPRNIQHHRLYWALVGIVHDNVDHERYPTPEDLSAAIKISAGVCRRIELKSGEVGYIPESIAFHKMDQTEFAAFYDRVCDLIAKHYLPGVNTDDLRLEVSMMIGAAA